MGSPRSTIAYRDRGTHIEARVLAPRRVSLPVLQATGAIADQPGYDPACVHCGRRRSKHADDIDVGDELMPNFCDLRGDGAFAEGPAERMPRPLPRRLAIAMSLTPVRARAIAGTLGAPSKMPGAAYGIDAFQCKVGDKLAKIPDSVCFGCYARKNFYRYWWPAVKARANRQRSLVHEFWVEAMISMITDYQREGGEPFFRWHDSGDLQGAWHLANICAVAEATPGIRHWLPTREYRMVLDYRAAGGVVPPNLTIRLSAHYLDEVPSVPRAITDMLTSTVHRHTLKPTQVSARRKDSIECKAYMREGVCGPCRACWDPRVRNISYAVH